MTSQPSPPAIDAAERRRRASVVARERRGALVLRTPLHHRPADGGRQHCLPGVRPGGVRAATAPAGRRRGNGRLRAPALASPGSFRRSLHHRVDRCRRSAVVTWSRCAELPIRLRSLQRRRHTLLSPRGARIRDRSLPSSGERAGTPAGRRARVLSADPRPVRPHRTTARTRCEEQPATAALTRGTRRPADGERSRLRTQSDHRRDARRRRALDLDHDRPRRRCVDRVGEAPRTRRGRPAQSGRRRQDCAHRHEAHPSRAAE